MLGGAYILRSRRPEIGRSPAVTLAWAGILLAFLLPASPSFSQNLELLQAQKFLAEQGYNPGPADGLYGNRTKNALQTFQQASGLPATGKLDAATLEMIERQRSQTDLEEKTRPEESERPAIKSLEAPATTEVLPVVSVPLPVLPREKPNSLEADPSSISGISSPSSIPELSRPVNDNGSDHSISLPQNEPPQSIVEKSLDRSTEDSVERVEIPKIDGEQAVPTSSNDNTNSIIAIVILLATVGLCIFVLRWIFRKIVRMFGAIFGKRKDRKPNAGNPFSSISNTTAPIKAVDDASALLVLGQNEKSAAFGALSNNRELDSIIETVETEIERQVKEIHSNPLPPIQENIAIKADALSSEALNKVMNQPGVHALRPSQQLQGNHDQTEHEQTLQRIKERDEKARESRIKWRMRKELAQEFVKQAKAKSEASIAASNRRGWIPAGESILVAGRDIGGLVYIGPAPSTGRYGQKRKCYIDPSLSVAKRGDDKEGIYMPYWPSYSDIPANARATYLDWLASGRSDSSYDPGYMFLYFYGLEQRFFEKAADEADRQAIVHEVERLKELYQDNNSAQRYLGTFLNLAQIVQDPALPLIPERLGWSNELPLPVNLYLGRKLKAEQAINAEDGLLWLKHHPDRRMRTPAQRCKAEFELLFRSRFNAHYPDGMKVRKPRKALKIEYQSASGDFTANVTPLIGDAPDISGLSKPVEELQFLADEAMASLDKYSRYLGPDEDRRGTVQAHSLLPQELRSLFPCEELDGLSNWALPILEKNGQVPVLELLERLNGRKPEKFGKRQLVDAADALAMIGVGMAPDPRFALRGPKLDDPVILFHLPDGTRALDETTSAYQASLLEIAIGTFIAQADGEVSKAESDALKRTIRQADHLSPVERLRLAANLAWFFAVPLDLQQLRSRLKKLDLDQKHAIADIVIKLAGADGIIQRDEVGQIEKIYKILDMSTEGLYSRLNKQAMTDIEGDEPISVRSASHVSDGVAIPPETEDAIQVRLNALDQSRLADIRTNTAQVSQLLGAIFDSDGAEDEVSEGETVEQASHTFPGLDAKHSGFVTELVKRESWARLEFEQLAKEFGLMMEGCLEVINEWSFEHHDEMLIEEDDLFEINSDIAASLTAQ
nr:TerB N-terminal domain-containing protein [uncultured Cohaesibacter sp.]